MPRRREEHYVRRKAIGAKIVYLDVGALAG
jgi:hypothetical protein